jgi:cbb3-type cytochrome oxidase subunit 3
VSRLRAAGAAFLASLLVAAPRLAAACAVCSSGRDDDTQQAFLAGTIFLSLLPPTVIGVVAYVLWRRAKRIDAEDAAGVVRLADHRPPHAPPPTAALPRS